MRQKHTETLKEYNSIGGLYAWAIVYQKDKGVYGVLLVSDRFKEEGICLLAIHNWVDVITRVVAEAAI